MHERPTERHPEPQHSEFEPRHDDTTDHYDASATPEQGEALPKFVTAVRQLLNALESCAGDPPDCPHCGPARSFALDLLKPTPIEQDYPTEQNENHQPETEQERLSLMGRVGAEPSFRTTPKGTLVARFPLAVHNSDNSTTWHQVLAFNARSEKLKDALHKGDAVQVVGYMHEREGKGRDGEPKTIRELYAVTVTARAK